MHHSKPGATSEQLRDDIDAGRTGDKVCAADPAVAPLGTDDEAAGMSNHPELIARVRIAECAKAGGLGDRPVDARRGTWSAVGLWLIAVGLACALIAATAAWVR
jgi:hypothetical protein